MNIFLDDVRKAPKGWTLIKTANEAIVLLNSNVVTCISLDHDLGTYKTGYDVVKWIEKQVILNNFNPPSIIVHSANPVGKQNILACIDNINKHVNN